MRRRSESLYKRVGWMVWFDAGKRVDLPEMSGQSRCRPAFDALYSRHNSPDGRTRHRGYDCDKTILLLNASEDCFWSAAEITSRFVLKDKISLSSALQTPTQRSGLRVAQAKTFIYIWNCISFVIFTICQP